MGRGKGVLLLVGGSGVAVIVLVVLVRQALWFITGKSGRSKDVCRWHLSAAFTYLVPRRSGAVGVRTSRTSGWDHFHDVPWWI